MRHSGEELSRAPDPGTLVVDPPKCEPPLEVMIRPELLKMLVCPENRAPLEVASSELLAKLNRAVAAGTLTNKAGRKLEQPLDGGLVRDDHAVLYPIVDEIPMMLVDEGIPLDQPAIDS